MGLDGPQRRINVVPAPPVTAPKEEPAAPAAPPATPQEPEKVPA